MSRVAIVSTDDGVDEAFASAVELADCADLVRAGARVLVKPNWNACGVPGSTSVAVVQAACRWAASRGAAEVTVGEGPVPVGRERIAEFLAELDVPDCLDSVRARFLLFDEDGHVLYHDQPDLPPEIGVARAALEADVIINLPLLKVHSCCLATLCLKNVKGCIRPQDKMEFHRVGLLPAIVALNRIVRPQIHVIDAVNGMEGDHNRGPLVPLGLLIAGRDPVAVDAVGCGQMGLEPGNIPLLRMAAEAGLGTCDLGMPPRPAGRRRSQERQSSNRIELVGEPLRPRTFELPQERLKRHYPDLQIDDAGACSACQAALMDGLYAAGGDRRVSTIALGEQSEPSRQALVLGRCLRDYWPTHHHVKGCPPSGHEVAQALCAGEGDA